MRVLTAIALAALASCYSPTAEDCQFTCSTAAPACPTDTTCTDGFCRTEGATGTCTTAATCTAPANCTLVISSDPNDCLASCSDEVLYATAVGDCATASDWHIAVLDTTPEFMAAGSALGSDNIVWIGLSRTSLTEAWDWATGGGTVTTGDGRWASTPNSGLTNKCAAIEGSLLYSDNIDSAKHAFACTNN